MTLLCSFAVSWLENTETKYNQLTMAYEAETSCSEVASNYCESAQDQFASN